MSTPSASAMTTASPSDCRMAVLPAGSLVSEPCAWAVMPVVPMRRKFRPTNRMPNTCTAAATAAR